MDSLSPKSLGPYGGGSYTGPGRSTSGGSEASSEGTSTTAASAAATTTTTTTTTTTVPLAEARFADLKEGLNTEQVTLGRVICSIHSEEEVPL